MADAEEVATAELLDRAALFLMSIQDVLDVGIRIFPLVTFKPPASDNPFPIVTAPEALLMYIGRKAFQLPNLSPEAVSMK